MISHFDSWLPRLLRVEGITLGQHVFFSSPNPSEYLVAHERIHTAQFAKYGWIRFILIYSLDYLANRIAGNDHYTAYRETRFEREAYKENQK